MKQVISGVFAIMLEHQGPSKMHSVLKIQLSCHNRGTYYIAGLTFQEPYESYDPVKARPAAVPHLSYLRMPNSKIGLEIKALVSNVLGRGCYRLFWPE